MIMQQIRELVNKIDESKNLDLRPYFIRKNGEGTRIYSIDELQADLSEYELIRPVPEDCKIDILEEIGIELKEGKDKRVLYKEDLRVLYKFFFEILKAAPSATKYNLNNELGIKIIKTEFAETSSNILTTISNKIRAFENSSKEKKDETLHDVFNLFDQLTEDKKKEGKSYNPKEGSTTSKYFEKYKKWKEQH